MLLLKSMVLNAILAVFLITLSLVGHAAVLELGESQLHGKQDQPEAMTFVSRAPVDVSIPVINWKAVGEITKEINKPVFKLGSADAGAEI